MPIPRHSAVCMTPIWQRHCIENTAGRACQKEQRGFPHQPAPGLLQELEHPITASELPQLAAAHPKQPTGRGVCSILPLQREQLKPPMRSLHWNRRHNLSLIFKPSRVKKKKICARGLCSCITLVSSETCRIGELLPNSAVSAQKLRP